MNRPRYLEHLRRSYPTAAKASAAKLAHAQNLRDRPSAPWALREAAAELREQAPGCAHMNDVADTFELAATLERSR